MTVGEMLPFEFFGLVFVSVGWLDLCVYLLFIYEKQKGEWPAQARIFFWIVLFLIAGTPGFVGWQALEGRPYLSRSQPTQPAQWTPAPTSAGLSLPAARETPLNAPD